MHITLFLAKKVNFGIYKFVSLQYDIMHKFSQQVAYFWDCTGVFNGPYVRVYLTGVKNPSLRAVRIDRTHGPDVRAQKNDARIRTGRTYTVVPYVPCVYG